MKMHLLVEGQFFELPGSEGSAPFWSERFRASVCIRDNKGSFINSSTAVATHQHRKDS